MDSCSLADGKCVPCKGGVPPLEGDALEDLVRQLGGDWSLIDEHHLEKTFTFPDFKQALAFTNAVGDIAEAEGHHPEITLTWGVVSVRVWTHKIDGLTESDFILAAKIDHMGG